MTSRYTIVRRALLYHAIQPAESIRNAYAVSTERFEQQLRWLVERGYVTRGFDDYWSGGSPEIDTPAVIITFDDAHASIYTTAFALLMQYGLRAAFFIPTDLVGRDDDSVTFDQLAEMASAGMVVGSHTHSHPHLDQLSREQVIRELTLSREILESRLGQFVHLLACPGGRYNATTLRVAREIGYRGVCTSRPGDNRLRTGESFYVFDRLLIDASTTMTRFADVVGGAPRNLRRKRLGYELKSLARRTIGDRAYSALWKALKTS